MGFLSLGSQAVPAGLDLGADQVRIAQVKASGANRTLVAYTRSTMPLGAVVDGEVVDVAAAASAIRDAWRGGGFKGRDVVIGVSNQKIVVRLIDLPFMEHSELQGAIHYQAQDYIPIPIDDAILDFHIIGDYMTPADEHMMEVLLVAAQRDMIASAVQAVESAGLRLSAIDVSTFAIARSILGTGLTVLPEADEEPGDALAIIHIGSGLTNIAVVEKGVPRFTRVSALSGNHFTQAIANVLNLTFSEAEQRKIVVGLPDISGASGLDPHDGDGSGFDPQERQVVQDALEREVNKFIAEVRRSLDYYLTQTTQIRTIRRIYMTGSGAQLKHMTAYLEKGLQTEVLLADPLKYILVSEGARRSVTEDRMGAAPSIGLALGGVL